MLINAIDPEESRIAVVEDGVLQELHVELANREAYLGNIYKGKVVNIEPSIGAAFVAFGGRVNGFLHVSDVLPAYGRDDFQLEDVIEGRARVDADDGPESMQQALSDDDDETADGAAADAGGDAVDDGPDVAVVDHDEDEGEPVDPEAVANDDGDAEADAADDDEAEPEPDDEPFAEGADETERPDDGADHADGDKPLNMAAAGDGGGDVGGGGDAPPVAEGSPAVEGGGERRDRRRGRRGGRDRGRAGDGERRPRGPRPTIDQLLKKGQEVVVQITKEGIGSKGPTLTTYISLPGRCLVLMPSLPKCGVSRKIEDGSERKRLKRIVRELDETGHGGIGFIVRTAGVNKSLQDLQRDRDYLKKIWEMVAQRLKLTRAPALLYQESDLVLKAMRDQFTPDIADVVVDCEDVFLRIRDFAEKLMPHMAERIKQHAMTTPLFHHFGIEKDVESLYQPKVDLPNGASIVIDQAEALVAIDVNSGRYKAGGDTDETAYRTNLDAIPEIVRQLRLRDLGGLIIIDFIDMAHEKQRRGVERKLIDSLRGDRSRIKVGRISPFGMLEITRQRVGPGLKRTVFMQCPHCKGAGWSRTVQSKALSVLREARALVNLKGFSVLQVFVAPAVADYLVNYKRRSVLELEDAVGKSLVFRPEASYPIDVVHYRFLTGDGQEARIAIPAGLGVKA
jgi:ribonuclease E